jgi:hypothetical protein
LNGYKERFEALEKIKGSDYEEAIAATRKLFSQTKTDIIAVRNDLVTQKKEIDCYRNYVDGHCNKDALEDELHNIKSKSGAFNVKLKKIVFKQTGK